MRKYRIISRITVLLLMIALVYFNLYEKKVGQLGSEEEIKHSTVLTLYDAVFGDENKPMLFRGDFEGGLWTVRIFSLSMSDPLAFISSSITALEIDYTLLLSILIPLGLLLLFGRAFCSWICPYSLFAEAGRGIVRMMAKFGIEYYRLELPRQTALFFLVISLTFGAILSVPITILIYPPRIFTEAIYHLILSATVTSGLIFLIFLWLGEIIFSPQLFCRWICPGGALFSIIGKLRVLKIRKKEQSCDMCGVCNPICPYDLKPALGYFPGECDNCGLCIDACQGNDRNALNYIWTVKPTGKGNLKGRGFDV